MGKIKKTKVPKEGAHVKHGAPADEYIRFSFKFFDSTDAEMCPPTFTDGYTITLMERLRAISTMKVSEFTANKNKSLRAHTHDWGQTSRPNGFNLNEQFSAYPGWQFELTANEHGRVHGIIIGSTFYPIWLDRDHKLYPG